MNDDNEHGAEVATNEEPQHSPNPVDPETIQHEGP